MNKREVILKEDFPNLKKLSRDSNLRVSMIMFQQSPMLQGASSINTLKIIIKNKCLSIVNQFKMP
jgi:hypothetical protein